METTCKKMQLMNAAFQGQLMLPGKLDTTMKTKSKDTHNEIQMLYTPKTVSQKKIVSFPRGFLEAKKIYKKNKNPFRPKLIQSQNHCKKIIFLFQLCHFLASRSVHSITNTSQCRHTNIHAHRGCIVNNVRIQFSCLFISDVLLYTPKALVNKAH